MLERKEAANGVVFYISPVLARTGVAHAFSTRIGGVSCGALASLNLGGISDQPDNIAENFLRLIEAGGCTGKVIRRVSQVHGTNVVWTSADEDLSQLPTADGVLSDDPRCLACVRVA